MPVCPIVNTLMQYDNNKNTSGHLSFNHEQLKGITRRVQSGAKLRVPKGVAVVALCCRQGSLGGALLKTCCRNSPKEGAIIWTCFVGARGKPCFVGVYRFRVEQLASVLAADTQQRVARDHVFGQLIPTHSHLLHGY